MVVEKPTMPSGVCTVLHKFVLPIFVDGKAGDICEILSFHRPDEELVSGQNMILRGKEANASMAANDYLLLWANRYYIPREYWKNVLVFPETLDYRNKVWAMSMLLGTWENFQQQTEDGLRPHNLLVRIS